MENLRPSTPKDMPRVLDIWRRAVDATHGFLAPEDRAAIERELAVFLPTVPLCLAVDDADVPQGFMLLHEGHMEALFVDPACHGRGIGSALIRFALKAHPGLTTDVNEANRRALAFYEARGFEKTGRSALDGQGRPYPLVHLRHRSAAPAPSDT
ncbi:acetyltransferase [Rhodovulum sulfidophilum]|uniref:acetyltransferase n=1 Tax=Rhodovulum sulfidophilum TaxID=35806 RepID=UPI0009524162|nr:acetyltransferase [Rhodovulum sulfidophilum]OLS51716.1 acetyltransferase [Rhodovulum sulfidophilum]